MITDLCPKCNSKISATVTSGYGTRLFTVTCPQCGLGKELKAQMSEEPAWRVFYFTYGYPKGVMILLKTIALQSGFFTKTGLKWQCERGLHSTANKDQLGQWQLPIEDAVKLLATAEDIKAMVPLKQVAIECGLRPRSLEPKVRNGLIKAKSFFKRLFVEKDEQQRVVSYYKGLTTAQVMPLLGKKHRNGVLKAIRLGSCQATRIGKRYRVTLS